MSRKPRIVFAGTPEFAVPSLRVLSGIKPTLVLSQPDRPSGRGRSVKASPIKQLALDMGVRVEQPETLLDKNLAKQWGSKPDLLIVVAYGLLLPKWMLSWPRLGCVNIHASLLPRWRGAAPIQYAILAGDDVTGITIMKMQECLDVGPVCGQSVLNIGAQETAGELHDRLAALGADVLDEILPDLLRGSIKGKAQDEKSATYAPRITKADSAIDWGLSAKDIERRVRAFNPWPISDSLLSDGRRLRIWQAKALSSRVSTAPGSVIMAGRSGIDVATGEGILRILRVQEPSGNVMSAEAYLAAHPLKGAAFGGK